MWVVSRMQVYKQGSEDLVVHAWSHVGSVPGKTEMPPMVILLNMCSLAAPNVNDSTDPGSSPVIPS